MTSALARAIDRRAAQRAAERCGLCGGPVPDRHRHVLDERDASPSGDEAPPVALMCVCVPCTLLFDREGAGGRHYRLIPQRRSAVAGVSPERLGAPVGLVFFVKRGDGGVAAYYPSPLGTTRAEVDAAAWATAEADSPPLAGMSPGVEALLVWTRAAGDRTEHWVVPVDDCYRLAGLVRRHWTGMSGGTAVWGAVAGFFEELRAHPGARRHEQVEEAGNGRDTGG